MASVPLFDTTKGDIVVGCSSWVMLMLTVVSAFLTAALRALMTCIPSLYVCILHSAISLAESAIVLAILSGTARVSSMDSWKKVNTHNAYILAPQNLKQSYVFLHCKAAPTRPAFPVCVLRNNVLTKSCANRKAKINAAP